MDDYLYSPTERVGDTFRVGGRPVEGHTVIRPRRGPRPPTERGEHMRVSTSNPNFVRTDRDRRSYRERPFDEFDGEYGPRDSVSRGGTPFRPNTQDLIGVGRMPMQSEEWDRYRYSKEPESRFRPVDGVDTWSNPSRSRRRIDSYDRDEVRFSNSQGREELPHFLTDDESGLPVEGDRVAPRGERRGRREFELLEDTLPPGVDRMSVREKEWIDLEERRMRRRPRAAPQDLRGIGSMPMRGGEWDDYNYPERRGRRGSGYYDDEDGYRRRDDYDYTRGGRREPYRRREFARGDEPLPEDLPPPRPRDEMRDMPPPLPRDELEEEYIREGPYMVRNGLHSYRREEDEERREFEEDRYRGDEPRPFYSREGADVPYEEYRRERNRDLYNSRIRDRPGSVAGPQDEESMGVDTRYKARQQHWSAGTSFDVA